jgi:hypothetical protein
VSLRAVLALASAAASIGGCVSIAPPATSALPTIIRPTPAAGSTSAPIATSAPGSTSAPPTVPAPTVAATGPLPAATPSANIDAIVAVADGEDAGTYGGNGVQCAIGATGPDIWSVQYGNMLAGPSDLSTLQITDEPDSTGNGQARIFSAFVVIGPIFGGRQYILSWDRFEERPFIHELQDNGSTATIHFRGVSVEGGLGPGGITIDITVNCPSVVRGSMSGLVRR